MSLVQGHETCITLQLGCVELSEVQSDRCKVQDYLYFLLQYVSSLLAVGSLGVEYEHLAARCRASQALWTLN